MPARVALDCERVVYGDATSPPPVVRTWLDLHDGDPRIARVAAAHPEVASEAFDVVAVAVPAEGDRAQVEDAVATRLATVNWRLAHRPGIFSGMNPHPVPERVLNDLGDKLVEAFLEAMEVARADLDDLRTWRPGWFGPFSERFLANFLHERLWAELVARVSDYPGVEVVDREPRREIESGGRYVIRLKRHRKGDKIATYPTQRALAFWTNEATLPGLERASLAMGYLWDPELRQVGDSVLSYRDQLDHPVWGVKFARPVKGAASGITWSPIDPTLPSIDLSSVLNEEEGTSDGAGA